MRRSHRRAAKGGATAPLRRILDFVTARIARRGARVRHAPPALRPRATPGAVGVAPASHGVLAHGLHHLFAAWAITGGVYLATFWGLTSFIDTGFLVFVQGAAAGAPTLAPQVIELDAAQYQDRAAFATWFGTLVDRDPRLIAIEIDLSPLVVPQPGDGQGQVDAAIDAAATNQIDVVLVAPVDASSQDDSDWIRKRCGPLVRVASSRLVRQFGWLVRYQPTVPSLGAVAADILRKPHLEAHATPFGLCPDDKPSSPGIGAMEVLLEHSAEDEWQGVDFTQKLNVLTPPDLPASGSVVFVGGRQPRDRIRTPIGLLPPVEAHAYIAGTTLREVPHWQAYALEVALGVLSGAAFQALWRRRDAASERYRTRVLAGAAAASWLPALARSGLLALMLVLVGVLAMATFTALSIWLDRHGTWLNPAPLVVGMALDSFLSHEREQRAARAGARHAPAGWRRFLAQPLAWFASLLILWSMVHLLWHLYRHLLHH